MASEKVVLSSPVMLQGLHVRPEPLAKVHRTGLSEVGLEAEPGIYPNEFSSVSLLSFLPIFTLISRKDRRAIAALSSIWLAAAWRCPGFC